MKTVYEAVCGGTPVDFTPYIDAHGHFGPWPGTVVPYARDYARNIAEMDRYGCDMVWMSASNPGYAHSMAVKNDLVFDFAEKYPDRIIPYCTLSANNPGRCLAELKRCLARGRCVGVKMHRYDQAAYTLRAAFLQPLFEVLADQRLVYMNHDAGPLDDVRWVLGRYPDLTVMAGHFKPAFNDLARELPRVCNCTCAAMAPDDVGLEVGRLGRSDTLLVGSDFSLFGLAFGIGLVAYAEISEQDKRQIMGLNAVKLMERMRWFNRAQLKCSPAWERTGG